MRRIGFVEAGKTPWLMRRGLEFLGLNFWLSKIPVLPRFHPWADRDLTDMRWLPINEDISLPGDAPMPVNLLYRLIEEASSRAVFHECACRVGFECGHYPVDVGCLLLGDSALEGPPGTFHEAGVEEAKALVDRAVEAGLVPVVGKARIDNFIFGIKDRHRLLTVCFCCECCCIMRYTRHTPMKYLEPTFPRLEGVAVEVTETCTGCGTCAGHCYMKAIEIVGGRARIDEKCRACGRCASVCPSEAIRVSVDDPEFLEKCYRRIRSYVDIGPSSP